MKIWILITMLLACQASATVEDSGSGSSFSGMQSTSTLMPYTTGYTYTGSYTGTCTDGPCAPTTSLPTTTPTPTSPGKLQVSIRLEGPIQEKDSYYTAPGKASSYIITVKNQGYTNISAQLCVSPESCGTDWFSWLTTSIAIPAGGENTETLDVMPDMGAIAGDYSFKITATAQNSVPGSDRGYFKIQGYDYASETVISGTGQFQLNKDVRSMNSGIKSTKDVYFSGSVDAIVKNEYLLDAAKGRNPNFEEQDAVDNYAALSSSDALLGSESFKSSLVFGGIGAKVQESYNLQEMEFKQQSLNLHQTGSLKRTAELKTADNFTGYFMLDAKQTKPGSKNLKEHEEYMGSFEIQRRVLFADNSKFGSGKCSGSACDFMDNLNAFAKSA